MTTICNPPASPKPGMRHHWAKLNSSAAALAISRSMRERSSPSLIITTNMAEAERCHHELSLFLNEQEKQTLHLFPDWETLPYDSFSPHQDIISGRLRCLYELSTQSKCCVIIAAQTLMQRVVPTDYLKSKSLFVTLGQEIQRDRFYMQLAESGYNRVDTVFEHGEFAVRGSLIDIYPMGSSDAFRIEFFDDEVESLREFDPETQRTIRTVDRIELLPGRECPLDDDAVSRFRNSWHGAFDVNHKACPVYQDVSDGIPPAGIEYFLPLFFESTATLMSYLPSDATVFSFEGVDQSFEDQWREINNRYESRRGDLLRPILPPERIFVPANELYTQLKPLSRIELHAGEKLDKAGWFDLGVEANPELRIEAQASNPLHRIERFLVDTQKRVLFCAETDGRREILKEHLEKIDCTPSELSDINSFLSSDETICLTTAGIEKSINSSQENIILVSENALFDARVQQSRRRKKAGDEAENIVKNLTELKLGAPVVHLEHGVGRYRGLQTIEHGGQAEEFLTLEYANESKLYVPVASLHLISRYSGAEESVAPLHRLGNEQWQKAKRKAAEKIRDVAAELLNVYARRKARTGYAHELPKDAYQRFSAEFPFEETEDQTTAIMAVRADMLSPQPMDRLVCGDVGFGKTEVAMRAAFISVQNSKQIAVLVPTTLLAQQHYENFKDRFANWPVNIDVISRFKTGKETTEVLKRIESGHTDIIIGTHKLIMGDIKFKNLGLVIIDEEHRFGVRQKETLKSVRAEVDILNLTATPIPRTLNMAMSGIRDLSIIATPPAKRLSVKTFVREQDDNLTKEAILREIMRGGQVYYLHNEVKSIEKTASDLQKLVPEAKIRIGHGQMRERELEAVMSDFYHKRFNILVCTTIIETGIDVPSANTIIIDRADKFGLAQLHQLRGRVGRSHHQAYAYLLSPNKRNITKDAAKRLEAIEGAQDLGAGFTLASHDLEIRGAGELLGDDQSGQMQTIGFTLYMEMLDRAVTALKNGEQLDLDKPFAHDTETNLRIPALIPDDYLPDVNIRLSLYKRLTSAESDDELEQLQVEMIDRFGLLPEPLKNLFRVTQLRFRAEALGIAKIEASARGGKIEFGSDTQVDPLALVKLVQMQPNIYKLSGANQLNFSVETETADARINTVNNLLDALRSA